MNISFLEWILNKLRNNQEEDKEWEPETLRVPIESPPVAIEEPKKDDSKKVVIIDI